MHNYSVELLFKCTMLGESLPWCSPSGGCGGFGDSEIQHSLAQCKFAIITRTPTRVCSRSNPFWGSQEPGYQSFVAVEFFLGVSGCKLHEIPCRYPFLDFDFGSKIWQPLRWSCVCWVQGLRCMWVQDMCGNVLFSRSHLPQEWPQLLNCVVISGMRASDVSIATVSLWSELPVIFPEVERIT